MEQDNVKEILELMRKLYGVITIKGRVNGFEVTAHNNTYAIPIIKNIIYQLGNYESCMNLKDLFSSIKQEYLSVFPAKSGLSEFYIYSDDFDTRKKNNENFDELHKQIIAILNNF